MPYSYPGCHYSWQETFVPKQTAARQRLQNRVRDLTLGDIHTLHSDEFDPKDLTEATRTLLSWRYGNPGDDKAIGIFEQAASCDHPFCTSARGSADLHSHIIDLKENRVDLSKCDMSELTQDQKDSLSICDTLTRWSAYENLSRTADRPALCADAFRLIGTGTFSPYGAPWNKLDKTPGEHADDLPGSTINDEPSRYDGMSEMLDVEKQQRADYVHVSAGECSTNGHGTETSACSVM